MYFKMIKSFIRFNKLHYSSARGTNGNSRYEQGVADMCNTITDEVVRLEKSRKIKIVINSTSINKAMFQLLCNIRQHFYTPDISSERMPWYLAEAIDDIIAQQKVFLTKKGLSK